MEQTIHLIINILKITFTNKRLLLSKTFSMVNGDVGGGAMQGHEDLTFQKQNEHLHDIFTYIHLCF